MHIGNVLVRRILVDTGSSTNLITLTALKEMGLSENDIHKLPVPLVGFNGEVKHTTGNITLQTFAKGVNLQVEFVVIDCPSSYNVILGRPWIHDMKAVASTYHQTVKFPTPRGVEEIRRDQRLAKECYKTTLKPTTAGPQA